MDRTGRGTRVRSRPSWKPSGRPWKQTAASGRPNGPKRKTDRPSGPRKSKHCQAELETQRQALETDRRQWQAERAEQDLPFIRRASDADDSPLTIGPVADDPARKRSAAAAGQSGRCLWPHGDRQAGSGRRAAAEARRSPAQCGDRPGLECRANIPGLRSGWRRRGIDRRLHVPIAPTGPRGCTSGEPRRRVAAACLSNQSVPRNPRNRPPPARQHAETPRAGANVAANRGAGRASSTSRRCARWPTSRPNPRWTGTRGVKSEPTRGPS